MQNLWWSVQVCGEFAGVADGGDAAMKLAYKKYQEVEAERPLSVLLTAITENLAAVLADSRDATVFQVYSPEGDSFDVDRAAPPEGSFWQAPGPNGVVYSVGLTAHGEIVCHDGSGGTAIPELPPEADYVSRENLGDLLAAVIPWIRRLGGGA